jgi:hypothetical protein
MKNSTAILCLLVLAVPVLAASAFAEDPERTKTYLSVKSMLDQGDTYMAVEFINGMSDPQVAGLRFFDLMRDFYWKDQSIVRTVSFGRAGIQFCLAQANRHKNSDPKAAAEFYGRAKQIAFNLASFTWPGWDEKGITLSTSDLKQGLDAAKLTVRLSGQLNEPSRKKAVALWMLGAQELANGRYDDAEKTLKRAKEKAQKGEDGATAAQIDGTAAIVKILQGDASGQEQFENALLVLEGMNTKISKMYAGQLKTAKAVFLEKK